MNEPITVNAFVISIGEVQYNCTLSKIKNLFKFTVSRILGYKEKGSYKLADPVYSNEFEFKPNRKQLKDSANVHATPDAEKYQPEIEKKTEVITETKTKKTLLT